MKTNPNIFPGLGQPKCQLYFDIQAMIAENGGRLKLADALESEMVKEYIPFHHKGGGVARKWEDSELRFIAQNRKLKNAIIAERLNRTKQSVDCFIGRCIENGFLKRKNKK